MMLLLSVAALLVRMRPLTRVAPLPSVTGAAWPTMLPLKVVLAPRVVAPTGSQVTLAAVAPPLRATTALADVLSVDAVRNTYRPGPFIVKVPVMVIGPAKQYTPGPKVCPPRLMPAAELTVQLRLLASAMASC